MSSFFELIDRYKFGLLAALTAYIAIFMYLQMDSYTHYFKIEAFHDGAFVDIPPEDIQLNQDNILVPDNYKPGEVKNMVADANDDRPSSMDDYSEYQSSTDVVNNVHDYEKQLYNDAGGDAERKRIQEQMDARNAADKSTSNNESNNQQVTSNPNKYGGHTMVTFYLKDRKAQNLANPGYTSNGNGTVVIDVVVNQNGNVTAASLNSSKSIGATQRMIEQGLSYARKTRFKYSETRSQKGWIKYVFVTK